MKDFFTYYEVLEIKESATTEEIKTAFRIFAQLYHPDKIQSADPRIKQKGKEKFQEINEAYQVLSDPEKRRQYDEELKKLRMSQYNDDEIHQYQPPPSSPPPPPPPGAPELEVSKTSSSFNFPKMREGSSTTGSFTIINRGGGVLSGTIKTFTRSGKKWLSVGQDIIDTSRHKQYPTIFYVNTFGLDYGFEDEGYIEIQSNGGDEIITIGFSIEVDESARDRFKWQFFPAIALIGASLGFLTPETAGPVMGTVGILLLSCSAAWAIGKEEGIGAGAFGFLIPFFVLNLFFFGLAGELGTSNHGTIASWRRGSAFGGILFFLAIGRYFPKPLFKYHCRTGKNLIFPVWILAGVILLSAVIVTSKTSFAPVTVGQSDTSKKTISQTPTSSSAQNAFPASLSGEWEGSIRRRGGSSPVRLRINQNRAFLSGLMTYEGVEEELIGFFIGKNSKITQIKLQGKGYRRVSGTGGFSLDSFVGTISNGGRSLIGNYKDAKGNSGEWFVSKISGGFPIADNAPPSAFPINISGRWRGKVGEDTFFSKARPAELSINQNAQNLTGKISYDGVEEGLAGEIDADGKISLKGVSYRRLSGAGGFNLDAFSGTVSDNGRSITGNYKDAAWNSGKWSVYRSSDNASDTANVSRAVEVQKTDQQASPQPSRPNLAPVNSPVTPTSYPISIDSSPSGATVYVNREPRGTTPLSLNLKQGSYGIKIVKEGYKVFYPERPIDVSEYGEKEYYWTLEKE